MHMSIEVMPPVKIAYLRQVGAYGPENKKTMEKLKEWAKSNALLMPDAVILGIAQDDPTLIDPKKCRYDACLVVPPSFVSIDIAIQSTTLDGGIYAVFMVAHTAEAVKNAWSTIFSELLAQHYQRDTTKPIIERYTLAMVDNHFCEICVPLNA